MKNQPTGSGKGALSEVLARWRTKRRIRRVALETERMMVEAEDRAFWGDLYDHPFREDPMCWMGW